MRLSIRSKLILYTLLPVTAVYVMLLWLGVSHVRNQMANDAKQLLLEQAHHQAARLALVFAQVPLFAESLGDLVLADPEQSQALLYAHLIDGLRRTPIAEVAAITYGDPLRGAIMRRGAIAGQPLSEWDRTAYPPGWSVAGDMLIFNRQIREQGERIGDTRIELAVADLYTTIEKWRSSPVLLFISDEDGNILDPPDAVPELLTLAAMIPRERANDRIRVLSDTLGGPTYWSVTSALPGFPWRISAITPTKTALEPAQREATVFAAGLATSLLAIVLIIGFVARQITRPLATLDRSVKRVAKGNFDVAPEVTSNDELGTLAHAIRRMARHIADRERQLRSSHLVLEQRVEARTSALQETNARLIRQIEETRKTEEALRLANEKAQQANKAKSEFLSNMSHELRTPLHGVLGYAQILRRDPTLDRSHRESLEAIERCGQHLLTLINDILDLTKIEAGQMEVDIQPVDLPQLLEDVRLIVAQRASHKGLSLKLQMADDLPIAIRTDPVKLKQILLNLLGNAVKFTVEGNVALRVARDAPQVLRFEVTDTGIGIPTDKIDSIFDAFHQARESQAIDGTGLGLAINQRLIKLLGGEALRVESIPQQGSRFTFRLPFTEPTETTLARLREPQLGLPVHPRLVPGDNCAVLVVDEQAESRKLAATLLRCAECQVEAVSNQFEAIQRTLEKPFDVILYDVGLRDQAIPQVVTDLRQHAAFGEPKIVAVSADVLSDAEHRVRLAGFDAYLAKPFNEQQLLSMLNRLIGVRFEPAQHPPVQIEQSAANWPSGLAESTAKRIEEAIEMGDIGSLLQLAEELAQDPRAPRAGVDDIGLMASHFDFDGLRELSRQLQRSSDAVDSPQQQHSTTL